MAHQPAVLVDHVGVEFPPTKHGTGQPVVALDDVSFDVKRGEVVALLGPSGCGKTTLLHAIAGILKPTSGSIVTEQGQVQGPGRDRLVLFQFPALLPWMTVQDNIMFGALMRGEGRGEVLSRATELVHRVGLTGFETSYPYQLSGGMAQRVQIAKSLLETPSVYLMDEPFGALDAQTRLEMWLLVQEVWGKNPPTVVFVTHDVEEALVLSDRIITLEARPGRVAHIIDVNFDRPRGLNILGLPEFSQMKLDLVKRAYFS